MNLRQSLTDELKAITRSVLDHLYIMWCVLHSFAVLITTSVANHSLKNKQFMILFLDITLTHFWKLLMFTPKFRKYKYFEVTGEESF